MNPSNSRNREPFIYHSLDLILSALKNGTSPGEFFEKERTEKITSWPVPINLILALARMTTLVASNLQVN